MNILAKPFLSWLFITGLWTTGFFWLSYDGIVEIAWDTDHFFIVTLMMSWFTMVSAFIGIVARRIESEEVGFNAAVNNIRLNRFKRALSAAWFSSSALLTLGLIGTVVGFIAMLLSAFIGKSFSDPTVLTAIMQTIGSNWATALFATATGLIGSLLIQIQAFIVDLSLEVKYEA